MLIGFDCFFFFLPSELSRRARIKTGPELITDVRENLYVCIADLYNIVFPDSSNLLALSLESNEEASKGRDRKSNSDGHKHDRLHVRDRRTAA